MKDIIESPATGAGRASGGVKPRDSAHDPQECDGQYNRDDQPNRAVATTCRGHRLSDAHYDRAPATEHSGQTSDDAHASGAAVTSSGDHCDIDALLWDVSAPPCDGHQEGEIQNAPAVATTCRGQSDETVRPSGTSEMKDIIESPATGADRAIRPLTPRVITHDPQECDGQKKRDDHCPNAVATTCRGHLETDPQRLRAPATEHSGQLSGDAHQIRAAVTSSGDHCDIDALLWDVSAPPCDGHRQRDNQAEKAVANPCPDGQQIGGQINCDDQSAAAPDLRFSDPLVQDIVEVWRLRNQMVKSNTKLALQAQAMCRRYVGGDKEQATKLYAKIKAGKTPDGMEMLESAILPFIAAMQPVERQRKAFEKQATKWAERLPIAAHAKAIKGFGYSGLARVVGECGDLSAYRTVSGVWKRAGLAVINGKRQRRVAGEEAIEHGYSPARRASFWNCMDALFRHQGKDDDATDWRRMYDVAKEKAMESETITMKGDGTPNGKHADARARRYVMKAILKHLTIAWRAANRSKEQPNA